MSDDYTFFRLRKAAKTYISKVFTYGAHTTERLRNAYMVMEGSDVSTSAKSRARSAFVYRVTSARRK